MHKKEILTELIYRDMKPALGCTEPNTIALVCAKARSLTQEDVVSVTVETNSGIYKNAFSCGIPGTDRIGNESAAALGCILGNPDKGFLVLEGATEKEVALADRWIAEGKVRVAMTQISSDIHIKATVQTKHDICVAEIAGSHTNYIYIAKNDEILYQNRYERKEQGSSVITDYSFCSLHEYARSVALSDIAFIEKAYEVNTALAKEGAQWNKCCISASLLKDNGGEPISGSVRKTARLLTGAAVEARFLGGSHPAMSITGSGAHGLMCTLPLYAVAKVEKIDREMLLRATALSYLVTMYVKECSGKLSAFCGCGIAGGLGIAFAIPFLRGETYEVSERAFINMASSITGMICTGGNQACAMKAVAAVDAAFSAVEIAESGGVVAMPNGISRQSVEETARNVGRIASPGMVKTEEILMDIIC